jgi:hypothetical protein
VILVVSAPDQIKTSESIELATEDGIGLESLVPSSETLVADGLDGDGGFGCL